MRRRNDLELSSHRLMAGLAVSAAVHVAAFAFVSFTAPRPSPEAPAPRALQIVVPRDDPVMEVINLVGKASGAQLASHRPNTGGSPAPDERRFRLAPPDVSEEPSTTLAHAFANQLWYGIVPAPELEPMRVETGFAPMYPIPSESEKLASVESEVADGNGPGDGEECVPPPTIWISRRPPGGL